MNPKQTPAPAASSPRAARRSARIIEHLGLLAIGIALASCGAGSYPMSASMAKQASGEASPAQYAPPSSAPAGAKGQGTASEAAEMPSSGADLAEGGSMDMDMEAGMPMDMPMEPASEEKSAADDAAPAPKADKAAEKSKLEDSRSEDTGVEAPPADPKPVITPQLPVRRACGPGDDAPKELYLSADDSNSQASAAVAASLIRAGRFVPGYSVRTYEFLNYYDIGYENTDVMRIVPQARAVAGRTDAWTLQVAAIAPRMDVATRRPLNLTLVLDTSGSMAGSGIENLGHVVRALSAQLRQGDIVSVVTFDVGHQVKLRGHKVTGPDDPTLPTLLDTLAPNNRTDLAEAIAASYDVARTYHGRDRLSRVVLISDGNTNTGQQSLERIASAANQAEDGAIFLVGVAVGDAFGLNYQLMDRFTDAGKGAFVFVDSKEEAERLFGEHFMANMEVAAEDVRAKLVLPPGFSIEEFHGEQISTVASEVVPQHLAPNDTMIYHQVINSCLELTGKEKFVVEAEFTDPATRARHTVRSEMTLGQMLGAKPPQIVKGDALVAYAEALKKIDTLRGAANQAPNPDEAKRTCAEALDVVSKAAASADDKELRRVEKLLDRYCSTLETGEVINGVCDCGQDLDFNKALGLCSGEYATQAPQVALPQAGAGTVAVLNRLLNAGPSLSPREGCNMVALSTGVVGERDTIGSRGFTTASDPIPEFIGDTKTRSDGAAINDLSQVTLTLQAPAWAKSFSFDFAYLSAEFPNYVGSGYNDTFYATIEAPSTHDGARTNISFDGNGRSIEINNNYFQNEYHPCYEQGSGFDRPEGGGSTCWLQTSWPIKGGETFTLTFSVHDEGDGVYASEVLLDNFQWHRHVAVGATDPIN